MVKTSANNNKANNYPRLSSHPLTIPVVNKCLTFPILFIIPIRKSFFPESVKVQNMLKFPLFQISPPSILHVLYVVKNKFPCLDVFSCMSVTMSDQMMFESSCLLCDTCRVAGKLHVHHLIWKSCFTPVYVNKYK
jgi:hypothetical protein